MGDRNVQPYSRSAPVGERNRRSMPRGEPYSRSTPMGGPNRRPRGKQYWRPAPRGEAYFRSTPRGYPPRNARRPGPNFRPRRVYQQGRYGFPGMQRGFFQPRRRPNQKNLQRAHVNIQNLQKLDP